MKENRIVVLVIILAVFISCVQDKGPESVLKRYVEHRFASNQDVELLKSLSTGALLESLNSLSGENLQSFLNTSGMKLKKFRVVNKNCTQTTCSIGYIVSFLDYSSGSEKDKAEIEVKKFAKLNLVDNEWKILEVSNVKTFLQLGPTLEIF